MTKPSKKRPAPVSIRFSESERALLAQRAGSKPLSTYVKSVLFDGKAANRKSASPSKSDREALARLLAWLGQTQLAAHLAVLANAAESGSLDMSEPVTSAVLRSCAEIEEMRAALMQALGKEAPASESLPKFPDQLVCHSFLTAAEIAEVRR